MLGEECRYRAFNGDAFWCDCRGNGLYCGGREIVVLPPACRFPNISDSLGLLPSGLLSVLALEFSAERTIGIDRAMASFPATAKFIVFVVAEVRLVVAETLSRCTEVAAVG